MFCNQCGAALGPGATFCSNCGRAVGTAPSPAMPAMPPRAYPAAAGRVQKHRTILGVLWLVRALMTLPGGLVLVGFSSAHVWPWYHMGGPWPGEMPGFLSPLLGSIGFGLLILAALAVVVGVGLLQAMSWARMFAIVLGIISLVSPPFGTLLGIYTLWVLLPEQSDIEYAQLASSRSQS